MRPEVPTLIFHGMPPVGPRSSRPRRPLASDSAITPRFILQDLPESDLIPLAEEGESRRTPLDVSSSELLTEDYGPPPRPPEAYAARSERPPMLPPPLRARARLARARGLLAASFVASAALTVAVGALLVGASSPGDKKLAVPFALPFPLFERGTAVADAAPRACTMDGALRVLARHALVAGGIEASASGQHLFFGVTTAARDGKAIEMDRATQAIVATARVNAPQAIRRVVPLPPTDEGLDAAFDADDKSRTVRLDGDAAVIGFAGGRVAWKTAAMDYPVPLFQLAGKEPVEALRAVRVGGKVLVAFRRAGAIWVGTHEPLRLSATAAQVGSPAIAAIDGDVVVAWAERADARGAWGVKWTRWRPGTPAAAARAFEIPAGGLGGHAMSPSVAAVDGESFFLAWTEGPVSGHQVRGQRIGRDGAAVGAPITVSAPGINAGQAQVVMGEGGHGAVAFLSASGPQFDALAAPVSCGL